MMEIRINKQREIQNAKAASSSEQPRRARKKAAQKIGKAPSANRRLRSAFKMAAKFSIVLLAIFFLASIFVYAFTSERFKVHSVVFHGCKQAKPKQLETMIRRDFPENILRIDLHRLKARLEKEPWIRKVEIRRILPSDLIIYVQERSPSAILELDGALMLADNEGSLLDAYDPQYGKLNVPVLKGFVGKDAAGYQLNFQENAARIRQALDMLSEIGSGSAEYVSKISEVDISDPNNLKIFLVDDSAEVYLGEKDYLKRFQNLIDNLNVYYEKVKSQNNDIAWVVDLRHVGKIVYSPRRYN
jgi:cell division protein FtsQ